MSSTPPGNDASSAPDPAEGVTQVRPGPASDGGTGQETPPSGDRSAVRTSLAERFAATKGASDEPVAPGPDATAPEPEATAPIRTEASAARPETAAGGSSDAPRFGATATSSATPAPSARQDPAGQGGGAAPRPTARPPSGPRRVRLSLARIDPWSVMKLSFLLSIAVGIGIVVAAAAMWLVLDSMQVFADIEDLLVTLDSENFLQLMDYLQFDRVISIAAIIAVIDVLLLTALSTLGAFLYNLVAALVGGLHLTLTDD